MTVRGLSIAEFAARVDCSVNTIKSYRVKGMLPPADVRIGAIDGWLPETVDNWLLHRPGRGHRYRTRTEPSAASTTPAP
ncbi:MAG: XRE family transcriptional regulator [Rhodococcus sp. (in: high G+C Gram-positive bacteria)]|uniref:XRE family transcriptional regulator n=1 Tax=Rhodococcus sp. TaxID=1831 RepID=UPI003BB5ED08